jgi:hypothetical protein
MKTALIVVAAGCIALAQATATNYDEAKVPSYRLPPLLAMNDGAPVRTAADWAKRRAEISVLLESQMFGRAPARPADLTFAVDSVEKAALGGKAIRKQVSIKARGLSLHLLLYLPANATGPVPVFVGLGFSPNQSVSADPGIALAGTWVQNKESKAIERQPAQEDSRGSAASRWQLDMVLDRGFGLATMYYGDVEPDLAGAVKRGVRGTHLKPGQEAPEAGDWGAIAAWAWGLSRVADYLETDKAVDSGRLALVGHSRLGKTALWAGAMDTRFGIVISNDSGEGGAAISRRVFGETVADLNNRFPHWFCGNYTKYSGHEGEMPCMSPAPKRISGPIRRASFSRPWRRARCTSCLARRESGRRRCRPSTSRLGTRCATTSARASTTSRRMTGSSTSTSWSGSSALPVRLLFDRNSRGSKAVWKS